MVLLRIDRSKSVVPECFIRSLKGKIYKKGQLMIASLILVNSLLNKIADTSTLIHTNQYNTDKQNLEKKNGDIDKKYLTSVVW